MRIAIVGPTYPYKGGGAQHTTELAHRLAALGHDVVIESWRAQYPSFLYPGQQTIDAPEGEPLPDDRRVLDWRRPDGWVAAAAGGCARADLVILAVLSPVQVPAYLGILYGLAARTGRGPVPQRAAARAQAVRRAVDEGAAQAGGRGAGPLRAQQAELARELTGGPVSVAAMPPHLPSTARGARPTGGARRLLFFGIVRPYKGLDLLLRALPDGRRR